MASVKELVEGKIAAKKVMVFSKSYCPFCTKAKKEFEKLIKESKLSQDDYDVLEIENMDNCDAIQNYLNDKTGGRSDNMASTKSLVDAKISGSKVMVFSKTSCPYCTMAKREFERLISQGELDRADYEVLEINGRSDCAEIQDYLKGLTGKRTVPRVFINGNFIGGGDETVAAAKSGKLATLVN